MIQYGMDIHQRSEGRVRAHHQEKEKTVKDTLKKQAKVLNPDGIDMTDLDEASIVKGGKGWMSK